MACKHTSSPRQACVLGRTRYIWIDHALAAHCRNDSRALCKTFA